MSTYTFDVNENLSMLNFEDEFSLMTKEFKKMPSLYHIKSEIFSDTFWEYLDKNYNVTEDQVLSKTELEVDEKNRIHKRYKYVVKCMLNKIDFIMISFFDEMKSYEDDDYHSYVSEDDKKDKVNDIIIYYDNSKMTSETLENGIINDLVDDVYLPSTKNQFFTIQSSQSGYNLKASYIRDIDIDLELNYGKDFVDIHTKIEKFLKEEKHGLLLFHGDPGTGKCVDGTTYVTIRDKLSGEIKEITIDDFNELMN